MLLLSVFCTLMCWTVSEASLHCLHLGSSVVDPSSNDLVLSACFHTAMIIASILSVSPPFFSLVFSVSHLSYLLMVHPMQSHAMVGFHSLSAAASGSISAACLCHLADVLLHVGLGMEGHSEDSLGLHIGSLHVLLWPARYTGRVSDDLQRILYILMTQIWCLLLSWLFRTCLIFWWHLDIAVSSLCFPCDRGIPRYFCNLYKIYGKLSNITVYIIIKQDDANVLGHFSKLWLRPLIHHYRPYLLWFALQAFELSPPPRSCLLFTGTVCFPLQAQLWAANCSSLPPPFPTVASCVGWRPSVSKLK